MFASLKEQFVCFTGIARLIRFLNIVCSGNYSHPRKHTSQNLTIYPSLLLKSTTFTQLFESVTLKAFHIMKDDFMYILFYRYMYTGVINYHKSEVQS